MNKRDMEKHQFDEKIKLMVFLAGLFVALVLALFNSPYAGEAFALLAGLVGGNALQGKVQ